MKKFIETLASVKVTTIGLLLLSILVLFGTLDQAENGLYAAQQKFFYSWLFRWYVPIPWTQLEFWFPFPGGALVLFALAVNLLASLSLKFRWKWNKFGLLIAHLGLALLLLGGAYGRYLGEEATMTLSEGEKKNYGESTLEWELAIWPALGQDSIQVRAMDLSDLQVNGQAKEWIPGKLAVQTLQISRNALAYAPQPGVPKTDAINASGIALLQDSLENKEPSLNHPGFRGLLIAGGVQREVIVYSGDLEPTYVRVNGQLYGLQLRRSRHHLPFALELLDFKRDLHGGTMMASGYSSKVRVYPEGEHAFEALIAMNDPLRRLDYTFFQASFGQGDQGAEISTFAVTKNSWRLLPYIASGMMGLGLAWHFLSLLIGRGRKAKGDQV